MLEKKILILGTTQSVSEVVHKAKEMGCYVVITDNRTDGIMRSSPDVDAVLDISTNDIVRLSEYVRKNNIDGVFTGASEFNIQNMIRLCEETGLKCYCSQKQWRQFHNKRVFKDLCRRYGVNTVPDYDPDSPSEIPYPVMLKPADSHSCQGLAVCNSYEDYESCRKYALSYSPSKTVLAEKLMTTENLDVYYTIQDGYVSLSLVGDWYKFKNKEGIDTVTSEIRFPSKYTSLYIEKMHGPVCEMIQSLGIKNGVINLQMFVDHSEIYVYEACFRLCATLEYNIISKVNGLNSLEYMIEYAAGGSFGPNGEAEQKDDPYLKGKYACNLAIVLKPGKIAAIDGLERIGANPAVANVGSHLMVGDVICDEYVGTLLQTFMRIHVICDSKDELNSTVKFVYENLSVTDADGREMIVYPSEK